MVVGEDMMSQLVGCMVQDSTPPKMFTLFVLPFLVVGFSNSLVVLILCLLSQFLTATTKLKRIVFFARRKTLSIHLCISILLETN